MSSIDTELGGPGAGDVRPNLDGLVEIATAPVTPDDQATLTFELLRAVMQNTRALERLRPPESRRGDPLDLTALWPLPGASQGGPKHDAAVVVDNPYDVTLEVHVGLGGDGPVLFRVPPRSSRGVVRRVRELSLVAVAQPAGAVPAMVVRYDRPIPEFVAALMTPARTSTGIADSLQAAGKVTAPGAGAAICTLAAPPAGTYSLEVDLVVSNVSDVNNMKLQRAGVDVFNPILVGSLNVSQHNYRLTLNGSQNITINAIAGGGVGVVYQAQAIATRVE